MPWRGRGRPARGRALRRSRFPAPAGCSRLVRRVTLTATTRESGGSSLIRVCAWCGISLGRVPPNESVEVSHGICPRCAERVQLGLDEPPRILPPCHWLVVVERSHRPLFWRLRQDVLDLPRAHVVFDRRRAERRRASAQVIAERRREERRRVLDRRERELWRLGVRIVHGGSGEGEERLPRGPILA